MIEAMDSALEETENRSQFSNVAAQVYPMKDGDTKPEEPQKEARKYQQTTPSALKSTDWPDGVDEGDAWWASSNVSEANEEMDEDEAQFKSGSEALQLIEEDEKFTGKNDPFEEEDDWQVQVELFGPEVFLDRNLDMSPGEYFRQFSEPFDKEAMIANYPRFRSPERRQSELNGHNSNDFATPNTNHNANRVPKITEEHLHVKNHHGIQESLYSTRKLSFTPGNSRLNNSSLRYLQRKFASKKLFDSFSTPSSDVRNQNNPTNGTTFVGTDENSILNTQTDIIRIPTALKTIKLSCCVGESSVQHVPIENCSNKSVTAWAKLKCTKLIEPRELYIEAPNPIGILPKKVEIISISFNPMSVKAFECLLCLSLQSGELFEIPILVEAKPRIPLQYFKPVVDFGGLPLSFTKSIEIKIKNVLHHSFSAMCWIELTEQPPIRTDKESQWIPPSEAAKSFSVDRKEVFFMPKSISSVEVLFTPRSVSRYRAALCFSIKDGSGQVYSLPLLGYGGRSHVSSSTNMIKFHYTDANNIQPKQREQCIIMTNSGARSAFVKGWHKRNVTIHPSKAIIPPLCKKEFTIRYREPIQEPSKVIFQWCDEITYNLKKQLYTLKRPLRSPISAHEKFGKMESSSVSLIPYPDVDTTLQLQCRTAEMENDYYDIEKIHRQQLEPIPVYIEFETDGAEWEVTPSSLISFPKISDQELRILNKSCQSICFNIETSSKWLKVHPRKCEISPRSSFEVRVQVAPDNIESWHKMAHKTIKGKILISCESGTHVREVIVNYDHADSLLSTMGETLFFIPREVQFEIATIGTLKSYDNVELCNRSKMDVQVKLKIIAETDSSHNQFFIRTRHKSFTLKANSCVKIPVYFAPKAHARYTACLIAYIPDLKLYDYMRISGEGRNQ